MILRLRASYHNEWGELMLIVEDDEGLLILHSDMDWEPARPGEIVLNEAEQRVVAACGAAT